MIISREIKSPNVRQPRTKNPRDSEYEIECSSDQIAFCVFYSFLEVQTMLAIYLPYMHA